MKYLLKDRRFLIYAALYLFCSILILLQPLFDYLGFEFSAIIGIVSFFVSSDYTYRIYTDRLKSQKKTAFSELFAATLSKNLLLAIIPFLAATTNIIFIKNCSYINGILFYLLIPCITVFYSIALSLLVYTFFNRFKRICLIIIFIVIIVFSVSEYYFNPQLFVYNPFIGFFPGMMYDEELYITGNFLLYRLNTIIQSIIFLSLANIFYQLPNKTALRIKAGKIKYAFKLPVIFLLVLLAIFYFYRNELRITGEKEYIKSYLGKTYTTSHFIIYYSSQHLNDQEIEDIGNQHEFYFQKICRELEVDYNDKIESFIYPDADTKFSLIGAKHTIIAKPWLNQIHLNENAIDEVLKHELVHVIAGKFGLPIIKIGKSAALIEGLAMAIEWQWGYKTLDQYSANIFKFLPQTNFNKIISTTGFISSNPNISYVLSGSFVKYLINNYGVKNVKELYRNGDYKIVTGKNEETLIEDWQNYLIKNYPVTEDSATTIFTFKRQAIFQKVCARVIANMNEEANRELRNGNFSKSIELFNKSISLSNNNEAKTGLIISMLRSGDYNSVIDFTNKLFDDSKNKIFFLPMKLYRADAFWQKAYRENKETLYDSAYKECECVYNYHLNENYDFASRGRMSILSNKKYREAMCDYYSSIKDDGLKLLLLSEVINKNPDFSLGKLLLARQLYNKNDYRRSLEYISGINDGFLSNFCLAEKYRISGLCCMKTKRYEQAINSFKRSLDFLTNESVRNEVTELIEQSVFMSK
jgi:hypothetical protein